MKRLLALSLFLVIGILFAFGLWKFISSPVSNDSKQYDFLINKGQTVLTIGKNLKKQGLIRNDLVFKAYVQFTGRQKSIQAGQYQLSPNMSLDQLAQRLVSGPTQLWVTYPEGIRREEIAGRTIKTLGLDTNKAKIFWSEFDQATKSLEGSLFPDTYLLPRDASAKIVIAQMSSTFNTKVTDRMRADAKKTGLTFPETIVLASIIERETLTDAERPVVAGILIKRINAGWPLQTDATLQYFTATKRCGQGSSTNLDCNWWTPPTVAEKDIKSPYNTYLNKGLPPAPIANPGISSIKAAIYPQDSPYWFYLHGKDGQIHYAKTIDEHNENIRKFL